MSRSLNGPLLTRHMSGNVRMMKVVVVHKLKDEKGRGKGKSESPDLQMAVWVYLLFWRSYQPRTLGMGVNWDMAMARVETELIGQIRCQFLLSLLSGFELLFLSSLLVNSIC